jgi:hypothetical protein
VEHEFIHPGNSIPLYKTILKLLGLNYNRIRNCLELIIYSTNMSGRLYNFLNDQNDAKKY